MSTRSPQNERNTNPDAKPGYMRKSAASAKPARSAASSVRVVPASSKEKRKQAERGESLAGLSKEEKRARKQAERLQVGQELTVNFTQASMESKVTVHSINHQGNSDTALLVMEGTEFSSEMVSMREQPIEIIIATYTGLKVPKSAVRVQEQTDSDGKTTQIPGVFILSGSIQKFKMINELFEADDYYVVEQSATNSDMLVERDQVIVQGKNLQNNMVVKT